MGSKGASNPPKMDVDALVDGLIKNNNLTGLMEEESKLFRQIRMLNSEFHTLLYENYNKLISAAQIIGQMSNNFDHMEQEVNTLSENMQKIIEHRDHLSKNLSGQFKDLAYLSIHLDDLKRLQFTNDLNELVLTNGQKLSKILIESIENENWSAPQVPRHVRPVVIRIIEDLAAISDQLAQFCDEGPHEELSVPHSLYKSQSRVNNPLMNNIKKLFSERVEVFAPVTFKRRNIMYGIVKIILKAMVECVRLETFNKNGVQQLQIDTKYLQHELSRFVSNENGVFVLLDEAVTSAEIRCIDDDGDDDKDDCD